MVNGVNLGYDLSFFGGSTVTCNDLSSSSINATVQDIMNIAVCGCQHHYLGYTAKYIENFGNYLMQVANMGIACLPTQMVNATKEHWQLSINNVIQQASMSKIPVKSGDNILWKFVSNKD